MVKTLRDYETYSLCPYGKKSYLTNDRTFSVSVIPGNNTNSIILTGIHKKTKEEVVEIISEVLKEKIKIGKSGLNLFKYLFNLERTINDQEEGYPITIKMNVEDCKNAMGYAKTQSVWQGLAELLEHDIIARSAVPLVYYLNPNFFTPSETMVITEYFKLI
jgi:hypothetical protein